MSDLSVVLSMDESTARALRADEAVTQMLDSYNIDSADMANVANADMRGAITRVAEIKALKAGFVAPAKTIIANAEALFDPAIEAQTLFAKGLRGKLEVWTVEQRRIADEARRVAEAEERRLRQEAEAKAAAERAKAEQQAADQRRQAAEAEERRKAAEAEGNAKAAAAAAAEAARLQEKAAATLENGEAKAAEAVMSAQAAVPVVAAPEKVAGFSLRDNWKGELLPGKTERDAIALIVDAIPDGRTDLLALLKLDMSAADKLAKALKKSMNVPGMQAVNRQGSMSRPA